MNKKGFIFTIPILIALAVVALIVFFSIGFFAIFNKYLLIGATIIVLNFVFLGVPAFTGKFDRNKGGFFVLIMLVGLLVIFAPQLNLVQQAVLSIDKVQLIDGRYYWIVTGVTGDSDEGFDFVYTPKNHTLESGKVLSPQKSLSLNIKKSNSYCSYQSSSETVTITHGGLSADLDYWILRNPARVINIEVTDENGITTTVDATGSKNSTIRGDNGGFVKIQRQGALQGDYDCPGYDDVAIILNSDTGEYSFVRRSNLQNGDIVKFNTFLDDFTGEKGFDGSKFTGELDVGDIIYTISADSQYFNSVLYTPPKETKPKITNILYNNKIVEKDTTSVKVVVENENENGGEIIVSGESEFFSFTPISDTKSVDIKETFSFNLQPISITENLINSNVTFSACSISQFTEQECDYETIFIDILLEENADGLKSCGDGICQTNEDNTTCFEDCGKILDDGGDDEKSTCNKFYQEEYEIDVTDCGTLNWKKYTPFIDCEVTTERGCKNAGWVNILTILSVAIIFAVAMFFTFRTNKRRAKK